MIQKQQESIHWLEFELLQPYPIKQGVFLQSLDKTQKEIPNILKASKTIQADQRHGNHVLDCRFETPNHLPADALITCEKNLALLIKHADCQVAIFYDPEHHIIANVHSGWRGSVQNIYEKTISHLNRYYQTNPSQLLVCIGPSLGPKHAEFKNFQTELPEKFWEFQITPMYFDFWAISRWQLTQAGVLNHHIEIAQECTYANSLYFSYRRDKTKERHATVALLT